MYAHWPQSCGFNPLAITTTLLFGLGNTAVAISKVAEHGSILTSGLIFAYSTWLCYAAISAFPDTDCNPMMSTADEGSAEHTLLLIVSIIVAGVRARASTRRTHEALSASCQLSHSHALRCGRCLAGLVRLLRLPDGLGRDRWQRHDGRA